METPLEGSATHSTSSKILKSSSGLVRYLPSRDQLVFIKSALSGQPVHVVEVSGAQVFFRDFEENMLLTEEYLHPGSELEIQFCMMGPDNVIAFAIMLEGEAWDTVNTRSMLDFVRLHALKRGVVDNVPCPLDPTIEVVPGCIISVKSAGVIVINNDRFHSYHAHLIDPEHFVKAYRVDRFADGYTLGVSNASVAIYQMNDALGVPGLSFYWSDSEETVRISHDQMDDLVRQMERRLAWDRDHPPDSE